MFNKKQLTLTILKYGLRIILAVAIAGFIISYFSRQIEKTGLTLAEKQKITLVLSKNNEIITALRRDLNIIGKNDETLENAFPPASNILDFVNSIENLATRNHLTRSYQFGTPAPFLTDEQSGIQIASVDYNANLKGGAAALLAYLKEFEVLPYFSSISSVNFVSAPGQSWESPSEILIQAKLYAKQNP